MKFDLINKAQLGFVAKKRLQYPLYVAEKDYFLTLALKQISESDLGDRLIFKGGTALHHHYLPQYRFSEDLDFTSTDQQVTLNEVRSIFKDSQIFTIKKDYSSHHTVKVEKLQYSGVLNQPSYLKIDISNVKNQALPTKKINYKNAWDINVTSQVMNIVEICAEKISAASNRARYRDFYDLFLITQELGVKVIAAVSLLKKKEVEKTLSVNNIRGNWKIAKKDKQNDLNTIFIKKEISNQDVETFLEKLNFDDIEPREM